MSVFFRYILRQVVGPLLMFTLVLSIIVWLTQSLQMLDLIVNRGQSAGTFLLLTIYVLPSLLAIIVPFGAFCATLYALNRLSNDSELIVMWSAGLGTWTVAKPLLFIGAVTTVATLLLNLYLMPAGYRALKDKVYDIRTDIATTLIRDGAFTNPQEGLTVYNRETTRNGELHALLVHDNRDREQPTTYMAKLGQFVQTPEGPQLIMLNGNIQQVNADGGISILYFERYALDLAQYMTPQTTLLRELSERYLHELLRPDLSQPWERANIGRLLAEGHNRLTSPLYSIVFVMIALCGVSLGSFNRRGSGWRIAAALGLGLLARLIGFALQSISAGTTSLIALQYLAPLLAIAACSYLLFRGDFSPDWIKKIRLTNPFSPAAPSP